MALSRALVRLRNEGAAIVSRPLGKRDVEPLYQVGTGETLRRLLTEKCGTAVADTNTVVTGWSLRHIGRLFGFAPRGGFAGGASTSAVSSPAPLWGGCRFFV